VTGKSNSWSSNWEFTRRKSRRNLKSLPAQCPAHLLGHGEIITLEESNGSAAQECCRLGNEEKEVFNMEPAPYWRVPQAPESGVIAAAPGRPPT